MKKLIFTLVVSALVATTAFAQDAKCYRGFTDLSYTLGVGEVSEDFDRFTLSTTHGYQLDDLFFVGAGVSLEYVRDLAAALVPIYVWIYPCMAEASSHMLMLKLATRQAK